MRGNRHTVFVDGTPMMDFTMAGPMGNGVGFWSESGRAVFDDLMVVPDPNSIVVASRTDYELGALGNTVATYDDGALGQVPTASGLHHEFVPTKSGYWIKDQLGSVRAVVREGAVVEWNDYYAYGAVRDKWSLADGRWKYLGKELDNETATQHLDAREYDPLVGFLRIDPLWAKYPSFSPYVYGRNNPMRFYDATGDTAQEIVVAADRIQEPVNREQGFSSNLVKLPPGVLMAPPQFSGVVFSIPPRSNAINDDVLSATDLIGITKLATMPIILAFKLGGKKMAHEIAAKIAGKFNLAECMDCADEIVRALKREGIKGEVLEMTARDGQRFIISDTGMQMYGEAISRNGKHKAVLIDGKVFDNIHKDGIEYGKWVNDFAAPNGFTITKTPF